MTSADWLLCPRNAPHPATQLLLVHDPHGTRIDVIPRCAEHPAADDVADFKRQDPRLKCAVVLLDDEDVTP